MCVTIIVPLFSRHTSHASNRIRYYNRQYNSSSIVHTAKWAKWTHGANTIAMQQIR